MIARLPACTIPAPYCSTQPIQPTVGGLPSSAICVCNFWSTTRITRVHLAPSCSRMPVQHRVIPNFARMFIRLPLFSRRPPPYRRQFACIRSQIVERRCCGRTRYGVLTVLTVCAHCVVERATKFTFRCPPKRPAGSFRFGTS